MKTFVKLLFIGLILNSIIAIPATAKTNQTYPNNCSSLQIDPMIKFQKGFVSLPCLVGKNKYSFLQLKGPLLLNVWGSWCFPCREELPSFVKAYKTGKIQIVGIDVEETNKQTPIKFLNKIGVTWPILTDDNSVTKETFGPGVPVTWFVDSKGVVKYKQIGVIDKYSKLQDLLEKYLGINI